MPRETLNMSLLQAAKRAFVTPDQMMPAGDPGMGGMDPMMGGMDPMMGGAPPMDPMMGGAPPMDPMMGGAPPMDPAAMGMPPPPAEVPAEAPAEASVTVPVSELFKFILDIVDHVGEQKGGAGDALSKLLGSKLAQERVQASPDWANAKPTPRDTPKHDSYPEWNAAEQLRSLRAPIYTSSAAPPDQFPRLGQLEYLDHRTNGGGISAPTQELLRQYDTLRRSHTPAQSFERLQSPLPDGPAAPSNLMNHLKKLIDSGIITAGGPGGASKAARELFRKRDKKEDD